MVLETALDGLARLGAGWVLVLLAGLSIAALAVIVERIICYWSSRDDLAALEQRLARAVAERDWLRASKLLTESPAFEARVVAAALSHQGGAPAASAADEYMLGETQRVKLELEQNLAFLSTLGSNAPFVGLLGTVIGLTAAFRELEQSQGALTSGLMSEIGETLIATAVGLLVALPAIAAFNYFRRVVQARLCRADGLRRSLLGHLKALEIED